MKKTKLFIALATVLILAQVFSPAALANVQTDASPSASNSNHGSSSFGNILGDGLLQNFLPNHGNLFCSWKPQHNPCPTHPVSSGYITISPKTATIAADQSQTYLAVYHCPNGQTHDVSTSPCTVWTINSATGTYTWTGSSVQDTEAGIWTVTVDYKGISDTASLTVTHAGQDKLEKIEASVDPTEVAAPDTAVGTATAYDIYGNSWDVSTSAVWSIPAGGDDGVWTQNVYTSHTAGTYTVQANYEGKTAEVTLTVTHASDESYLDHVAIAPKTASVNVGVSQSYTATAYDTFGNSWSVTAVYSCLNPNMVVSGNTVYSPTAGSYVITGTYGGKSDTAALIVTGHLANAVSITVSPKTASVTAGSTQAFTASASDGYNTWDVTSIVNWSINASAAGFWIQNTGTYTSANAGTWTVTATMGSLSDTATLTVNADQASPSSIVISPKTATVTAGTPQDFTAIAYDQFGNSLGDVTSSTAFTAPGASVTGNSVTADNAGSYTVTATYSGLTDTANLTVTGYSVSFTESGLPSGTSWTITFADKNYSSTTNTIAVSSLSALSYSWNATNAIQNGQTRYLTAQTSGSLSIPAQLHQNIVYSTQYLVSYAAVGNTLSVLVPAAEWVNSGGQASGSFPAQVANDAQNTRCMLQNDNRTATVTEPQTITGTYQTQYYLTVNSQYNVATGEGWYNAGASAIASLNSGAASGPSGTRYVFTAWGGSASGTALTSCIEMNAPSTANALWTAQFQVTYAVTGNQTSITVPPNEWVSSGDSAQGQFPASAVNSVGDTQCLYLSDNRTQTITEPTTIDGAYQTQYKVTFSQTGIGADAKGTIITVNGSAEDYSQLANTRWIDAGTQITFSFEATVASTSANKQYTLTSVNATSPIEIDKPTLIQGSYQPQYSTTLFTIGLIALLIFAIILTTIGVIRYRRRRIRKQKS